ncbi:MAG: 4Fe-4S binding protein [Candidatus Izemoplasma sp.]|nr:4Fe-4S binding protein [Candidatus Izemoplasma sp.]
MLNKTGVPEKSLILSRFPDNVNLGKPKAITECYEPIPCNPCETSCPFDAITVGKDINTPPKVDFDQCTGCGICVYSCPGLAIIVAQIKEDQAFFKIAYEFSPLPEVGETVHAINREGNILGTARIEKVTLRKKQDKTALIDVSTSKDFLHEFVTIRRMS